MSLYLMQFGGGVSKNFKGVPLVKVFTENVEFEFSQGGKESKRIVMNLRGGGLATDGIQSGTNDLAPTMHRDAVTQDIANALINDVATAKEITPYSMTPSAVAALISVGIPASNAFTGSHRHPAHKAIENFILLKILPRLITGKTAVMWMKPAKFERLRSKNNLFYKLINRYVTPKDYSRYNETVTKVGGYSTILMHDAMHYLQPKDVMNLFKENKDLNEIVATIVYPAEVLRRENSFFPLMYDLTYQKETFTYSMERDTTDCYIQPYCDWVITTSSLKEGDLNVTIERIEGFYGHHILVFRKGFGHCTNVPCQWTLHPIQVFTGYHRKKSKVFRFRGAYMLMTTREIFTCGHIPDGIFHQFGEEHISLFAWVHPSAWEYLTTFVISATEIQGDKLNLSKDLNSPPLIIKLRRSWANRGKKLSLGFLGCGIVSSVVPLSVLGALHILSAALTGGIAGVVGVSLMVGGYILAPPWQSPTEKETRRLNLIYPDRFTRIIKLKPLDLTKSKFGKIWNLECKELGDEDDEFPEYKVPDKLNVVEPGDHVTKPDSIIDDGTTMEDIGPSISQVNVETRRYVDKCVGTSENYSLEELEEDEYCETVVSKENESAIETIFNQSADGKIIVNLPKIMVSTVSSKVNSEVPSEDNTKLIVPQIEVLKETDVDGEAKMTKSKKRRLAKKKREEKRKEVLKSERVNVSAEALPLINDRLVKPSEGPRGDKKLHEIYGLSEEQVFEIYHGPVLGRLKFDGEFDEVPLCLIEALSKATGMHRKMIINPLKQLPRQSIVNEDSLRGGLTDWHATAIAYGLGLHIIMKHDWGRFDLGVIDGLEVEIFHSANVGGGHFSATKLAKIENIEELEQPKPGGFYGASSGTILFSNELKQWRSEDGSGVPFLGFRSYVFKTARAKPLARDMANGRSGIVFGPNEKYNMGQDTQVRWKALIDGQEARQINNRQRVHVAAIYGYPGCGKSWPIAQILKKMQGKLDFRVSLPTVRLREEWHKMLQLPEKERWRVNTYESTMRKHTEILVIDEISMMPAGYVDFLIAISPRLRCILILGDVTQTDRFETHPDATCALLQPEAEYWSKFSPYYLGYTRRLSKNIADLFGVVTSSKEEGFSALRMTRGPEPIITALAGDSKTLAELGVNSTTFPSSQGSTFEHSIQILMDRAALERCSLGAVHTAVTRTRKGIFLVGSLTGLRMKAALANPFWNALITGNKISWKEIFEDKLRNFDILESPYMPDLLRGGMDDGLLVEHNFPLEFLPPSRRAGHTMMVEEMPIDYCFEDPEPRETLPRVTWGQMDAKQLFDSIYKLRPVDSTSRMKRYNGEPSQQFSDGKPEGKNEDGVYPEQIAARHTSKDETLLPLSVPKRLRFRKPAANKRELMSKFFVGQELFQSYCRLMKLNPLKPLPFDEQLYHACIQKNEWHSLTNKTQKAILANEYKSDPDWAWTFIRIFMKQQRKVNVSTINGDWKAGQTISNMNDQWLLFLGPTIRYMTLLEKRYCPDKIYLHGGRSNIDLDDFCRKNLKEGLKYANDYTAFDQSQTGEVLASELLYMWHASIPQFVIDLYESNKVSMNCFLGPLQTMRFSGEPATYAFNCRCNLAVLNLQFCLDLVEVPVMVSGDDGGLGAVLPERSSWKRMSEHLSLRAKPEVANRLLFVGYICTHFGAIRDPVPMLARFYLASDAGKLHLIVQSYATELSTGYLMAENVFSVLDNFELDCFFCLVRAFHLKHASSKLKFRKSALLGFVNTAERALGRLSAGSKVSPELKRDITAFYWRLPETEREAVFQQTQLLVKSNLLQFGRRA
uniref:RdRp n=1 Tax=Liriodendron tulipifera tymovirus 1 TaxID=2799338 RepID=A0A7T5QZE2_9VIRU|nr:RdRp [Liriodendron tulipifera tymovirus 1]